MRGPFGRTTNFPRIDVSSAAQSLLLERKMGTSGSSPDPAVIRVDRPTNNASPAAAWPASAMGATAHGRSGSRSEPGTRDSGQLSGLWGRTGSYLMENNQM